MYVSFGKISILLTFSNLTEHSLCCIFFNKKSYRFLKRYINLFRVPFAIPSASFSGIDGAELVHASGGGPLGPRRWCARGPLPNPKAFTEPRYLIGIYRHRSWLQDTLAGRHFSLLRVLNPPQLSNTHSHQHGICCENNKSRATSYINWNKNSLLFF